ncbi:hypothetical protein CLF_107991 [Clonorchis sinensis]|uniref:BPTI/Kunitz inhibitor domain-containing protein n=1 Tax=Clonorchis sinensis TaxID=79923 RepID=G7YHG4_CLOSI|nr:hypothetical protein CLF_107991 [Clonorchis sinensis]
MHPVTFITVLLLAYGHTRAKSQKPESQKIDRCSLPIESGPGRALLQMYAFNGSACVQFTYGGLGGNANRFSTEEECLEACSERVTSAQYPAQPRTTEARKRCRLPKDEGTGRAAIPMFAFDGKNCVSLTYRGAGGNANRFFTKEECEAICKRD